jgi:RNAse (barnase) inhibitor barstar
MQEITIYESDFPDALAVHDYLAEKLSFPTYYGRNLSALADCLEDVDQPTRIVVERVDDDLWDERPWFGRICRVLQRVGLESDALEVVFRR